MATNAEAVSAMLGSIGVRRIIGEALGSLEHRSVDDPDVAVLLADADGRVNGGWGAAFLDEQILHLSSQPGGVAHPVVCCSAAEVSMALAGALTTVPHTLALHLDLDLSAPCPDGVGVDEAASGVVATLAPELAELDIAVVVGPGLIRSGPAAVEGLDAFARHSGLPVVNTFGAKGVFRWDSPFHAGTVGLQERDLDVAGVTSADLVITSGIDPAEIDPAAWGHTLVLEVDPLQFAALAHRWSAASGPPAERSELYRGLASAVTPLYEDASGSLNPARAALHLSGAAPEDGVVVADAGPAGFWVGRTFPTGRADSVVVCARPVEGAAVAGALVASWEDRPAIAVTHELGPMGEDLLGRARSDGSALGVQVWEPGDLPSSTDDHANRSVEQFVSPEVTVERVALETAVPAPLIEVAGAVSTPFAGTLT